MHIELCREIQTCNECNNARNYRANKPDKTNIRKIYYVKVAGFSIALCYKCLEKLTYTMSRFKYEQY